jgi:iron(III) transport system substrate-binding protein
MGCRDCMEFFMKATVRKGASWAAVFIAASLVFLASCGSDRKEVVVVYTAVDREYAEPIFAEFQKNTGITVRPVYDVEASKTTGLVTRLTAEKDRPRADVFWNNEFSQTILLQQDGVLTPYVSPNAADIPAQFKDPGGYWTCFGGRARILIVNTDLVKKEDFPRSIYDFLDPRWPADRIGMANPLFGTTKTHAAALYALLGPGKAKTFFGDIRKRGVRIIDGNALVRDLVARGELMMGLTDTDDACVAADRGDPVAVVFPDQETFGTLIVPNSVALIRGGPNPDEGKLLIDYLTRSEVEDALVKAGFFQTTVRESGTRPTCLPVTSIKGMDVSYPEIVKNLSPAKDDLSGIFLQ